MRPLLVATTSQHKLEEYRALLAGLPFELRSLCDAGMDEDVEETGATFEANARLKAERYRDLSGLLTLADDSGLEVDALHGEPGVHSKRWAGDVSDDERNSRLLVLLANVPDSGRKARYRCVIALAEPGRETTFAEGSCEGLIVRQPAGTNGFGYDPLFFVPELNQTFAQAPPDVKNRLSHRARAAAAARPLLNTTVPSPAAAGEGEGEGARR
ncbi:MAG TPA: RdgB/HAM1 family non-canonical purine NTP pyrophosphatase [Chloroflexota bacterium]